MSQYSTYLAAFKFTGCSHSQKWVSCRLKFDDERLTKEDMKRALDEQYGEEKEIWHQFISKQRRNLHPWRNLISTVMIRRDASVEARDIFSQVTHTHDVIIPSGIPLAIANILTGRLNDRSPWIDEKWVLLGFNVYKVINNGNEPRRKRSRSVPVPEEDNNATDLACAQCGTEYAGFRCNQSTVHLQCHACGGMMPSRTNSIIAQKCIGCDRALCGAYSQSQQMTTSSANNSVFRGFFEKQKLTGPNFIDWYRQLRIVLSIEDKLNYLEQPLPPAPVAPAGQQVAPEILAAHTAWVKGSKEIAGLMLMTMDSEIQQNLGNLHAYDMLQDLGKTVNELHAMLKLHEQTLTLPKNNAPALHAIRASKVQKGIFAIELNTFLNRSWIYDTGCSTHICNTTQGLRASRKLKPGALSLYVGNGQCEAVEAIGNFDLSLPSGLVIVLNNCHYAPSITRGVISVSRLCIFEIDLSNSYANESSIYTVSNKRAKLDLDSALLWHCRLGHISKKCIEKLQHDGLLNSTDLRDFDKYVPCMSVKMDHGIIAHRTPPYTPQHNGVSERRNRTLLDMVRSMMSQTTLPKSFWDYALETAARILNMVPTKKVGKTPYEPDKLEPRSIKCIFIGYLKETMGYSFYNPHKNKVLVARNAEFLENSLINQEASRSLKDLEIIQEEDMHPSIDTSLNHEEDDLKIDEPQSDIIPIRDLGEPANYKAALLDPESDKWLNAMNVEMQSMKDNELYTYKARLVAKGYTQTPGIDYEETFSPVADIRAIRILIAIAAYYDYEIWQMDVKTAFLNGYLNEEVYMEQPEGFVNPKYPNRVCKLKRSIYGLKQASRQWNKRFDDEIKKFGFTQNRDEPCVYLKASRSNVTFLILYVDDILIMGNNIPMLQDVKSYLGRCFAMKDLGEAAYILGIKIYRDRSRRLIGLCQSAYIEKILKRFHMENSKRGSIPMQEKLRLSKSQGASTPAELKRMQNVSYTSAVGSIMVSCYTDVGYLTDADDLKSQTGYVFVLNGGAVDWKSAKQSIFATSSAEAKYIAAYDASKEAVWVRKFIFGLGVVPIKMYYDNTRAIAISKESGITKGAKHFQAKVHYLREVIEFGDIKLEKVHTDDNLADPFTKALAFLKHSKHTRNIGMLPASSLM
ncbi:retrotransposon protein, putative, ty1-copia subclass [Tanacetum coccineum]